MLAYPMTSLSTRSIPQTACTQRGCAHLVAVHHRPGLLNPKRWPFAYEHQIAPCRQRPEIPVIPTITVLRHMTLATPQAQHYFGWIIDSPLHIIVTHKITRAPTISELTPRCKKSLGTTPDDILRISGSLRKSEGLRASPPRLTAVTSIADHRYSSPVGRDTQPQTHSPPVADRHLRCPASRRPIPLHVAGTFGHWVIILARPAIHIDYLTHRLFRETHVPGTSMLARNNDIRRSLRDIVLRLFPEASYHVIAVATDIRLSCTRCCRRKSRICLPSLVRVL